MFDDHACAHGDHLAPATGGTCPCGLVVRVPVARPVIQQDPTVRDLVARCLVERGGVADLPDLRRRADRILGALADAGLLAAPRSAADGVAGRRSA